MIFFFSIEFSLNHVAAGFYAALVSIIVQQVFNYIYISKLTILVFFNYIYLNSLRGQK